MDPATTGRAIESIYKCLRLANDNNYVKAGRLGTLVTRDLCSPVPINKVIIQECLRRMAGKNFPGFTYDPELGARVAIEYRNTDDLYQQATAVVNVSGFPSSSASQTPITRDVQPVPSRNAAVHSVVSRDGEFLVTNRGTILTPFHPGCEHDFVVMEPEPFCQSCGLRFCAQTLSSIFSSLRVANFRLEGTK